MKYSQERISQIKALVLEGREAEIKHFPSRLMKSWIRSRDLGLQTGGSALPASVLIQETSSRITKKTVFLSEKMSALWRGAKSLLADINAAIFILDENLCAYVKGGSETLLSELKSKNIRFSTSFSEQHIGSSAVSLSAETNELVWTFGQEHYSSALTDYCFCAMVMGTDEENRAINSLYSGLFANILIILPYAEYDDFKKKLIEYVVTAFIENFLITSSPEEYIKDKMLEDLDKSCILITDHEGLITYVNGRFCSMFDVTPVTVLAYNIREKMKMFAPLIEDALRGNSIRSKPLSAETKGGRLKEFYADCSPVYKDSRLIGASLKITDINQIRKYVNRIVSYNPHFTFDDIVGKNPRFAFVKDQAQKAADSSSNVLILGESGTGKELFAQSIHNASSRARHPFVAINCAAIPQELIGSELFGYVEGAFTGAKRGGAMGKFEQANNGTVFLDEISEMSLDMQAVLLRVLEERVVIRLGDTQPHAVNVRIIAASNRNLIKHVQEGKFRLDLFYRLNVICLEIPPLRERIDDLPELSGRILRQLIPAEHTRVPVISSGAMTVMQGYSWPGNVRELRNVLERCLNTQPGLEIFKEDLPREIFGNWQPKPEATLFPTAEPVSPASAGKGRIASSYMEAELERVKELMQQCGGNKSLVAKTMGISRGKLQRLLDRITQWEY